MHLTAPVSGVASLPIRLSPGSARQRCVVSWEMTLPDTPSLGTRWVAAHSLVVQLDQDSAVIAWPLFIRATRRSHMQSISERLRRKHKVQLPRGRFRLPYLRFVRRAILGVPRRLMGPLRSSPPCVDRERFLVLWWWCPSYTQSSSPASGQAWGQSVRHWGVRYQQAAPRREQQIRSRESAFSGFPRTLISEGR